MYTLISIFALINILSAFGIAYIPKKSNWFEVTAAVYGVSMFGIMYIATR